MSIGRLQEVFSALQDFYNFVAFIHWSNLLVILLERIIFSDVNDSHLIDDITVLPPFLNSDHNVIVITMQSVLVRKATHVKRVHNLYAGDFKLMRSVSATINWEYMFMKLSI